MEKNNDNMDRLFEKLQDQWDIHQPDENHYDRFLEKQARKTRKRNYWYSLSIAASILLLVGFFTFFNNRQRTIETNDLEFASKQTKETDSIFTAMIRMELDKVKEKKSPINEKIVSDALVQMEILDKDYDKIKQELIKNGESKQIIYAMIRNLQTRISFLEDVLEHLENNEKLNNTTHENTM
ncbi:MAG TPA: hypothetical protein VK528_04515 [Flavobacterium sp.]|nr:hypothetical protein [Flavobacterium sp.]